MKSKKVVAAVLIAAMITLLGCKNLMREIRGISPFENYDNVVECWQNENVSDRKAAEQAIEALLKAADDGDKDKFMSNFTEELQESRKFKNAVKEFFKAYPEGLSECELEADSISGGGSYDYGHNVLNGYAGWTTWMDDEWYRISMSFCYENTDAPEKVGVVDFYIMNMQGDAVRRQESYSNYDYWDDIHLLCDVRSSDEVDCRMINGIAYLWNETDNPKLTPSQMRAVLEECGTMQDLIEMVGEPNAAIGDAYYYELASDGGGPRYLHILAHSLYGRIVRAVVCGEEEGSGEYGDPLYENK